MANIRKSNRSRFTPLSNGLLQDSGLSFSCRGMMGYLLSKPIDWEGRPSDIEREGNIGRDARRAIMVEAEKAGYLTFNTIRKPNGQFESWYDAHEEPVPESERTKSWETGKLKAEPGTENPQAVDDQPGTDKPLADKPLPGSAASGKPVPLIKTEVQNTDLQKTEGGENPRPPAFDVSAVWQEFFSEPLGIHRQTVLESEKIENEETFRAVLAIWNQNGYSRRNLSGMIERYHDEFSKQQTKQPVQAEPLRLAEGMPAGMTYGEQTRWLKERLAKQK